MVYTSVSSQYGWSVALTSWEANLVQATNAAGLFRVRNYFTWIKQQKVFLLHHLYSCCKTGL